MQPENHEIELVVSAKGSSSRVVGFGDDVDAVTEKGTAVAFGYKRCAHVKGSVGQAVAFGGGTAQAQTAVSMLTSGGMAIAERIAVALNHAGMAIGGEIAIADNLDSQAHSDRLAVSVGRRGLADGLVSISLGQEGRAVAREGGTIAIAFYEQLDGHWETAHGCDPCWIDGDFTLSGLRVAKVGDIGIRANFVYQLDPQGKFIEVGPAQDRSSCANQSST